MVTSVGISQGHYLHALSLGPLMFVSLTSVRDAPLGGCFCTGSRAGEWDSTGRGPSLNFYFSHASLSSTCPTQSVCAGLLVPFSRGQTHGHRVWYDLLIRQALECFTFLYRLLPSLLALMCHTMSPPPRVSGALKGSVSPSSSFVAVSATDPPFL